MSALGDIGIAGVFRRHARRIAVGAALLLVTALAGIGLSSLAGGFLTAAALTLGVAGGFNFFSPAAGIRALTLARILARYGEKLVGHAATLHIARDLRVWFFTRLTRLTPVQLGSLRGGDLLARLLDDIAAVDGWLVRGLGPLAALAGATVAAVAVAAWIAPAAAGGLALLALAIGGATPWLVADGGKRRERRRAARRARLRAALHEFHEGAGDLAALGASSAWIARIEVEALALARIDARCRRRLALGHGVQAAVGGIGVPAMVWLVCAEALAGRLSPPLAAALVLLTLGLLEMAAGLALAWQAMSAARASARRLERVARQSPTVGDPPRPISPPSVAAVHFDRVRFAWRPRAAPLLDGLQLRIEVGERVAVCGDSGVGKSTLAALLLRSVDPQQGALRYGGTDLRAFNQAQWLTRLAWLPQAAPVFAGSVRANLGLAGEIDDARMLAVLEQLRLADWLRRVGGLDAWVGEDGGTMSAGQARRLALARALLRAAPVVVLDEPTEGLDVEAATRLLSDLPACLGPRRSLLVLTHAALPPGSVDRALSLRDGRLWPL